MVSFSTSTISGALWVQIQPAFLVGVVRMLERLSEPISHTARKQHQPMLNHVKQTPWFVGHSTSFYWNSTAKSTTLRGGRGPALSSLVGISGSLLANRLQKIIIIIIIIIIISTPNIPPKIELHHVDEIFWSFYFANLYKNLCIS